MNKKEDIFFKAFILVALIFLLIIIVLLFPESFGWEKKVLFFLVPSSVKTVEEAELAVMAQKNMTVFDKTFHPKTIIPLVGTEIAAPTSPTKSKVAINPNWSFGSFFETFSGDGFIDQSLTSLYHDKLAAAMIFEPDYNWAAADQEIIDQYGGELDSLKINNFSGPYQDEYCLAGDCLSQDNQNLFYNGRPLAWPAGLDISQIAGVSISALDRHWLIGVTLRDFEGQEERYKGVIYYFDKERLAPLPGLGTVSSPYFGLFGFGGQEEDFLIIYGGRQGIAYHVKGQMIENISRFFDFRAMNGGFKAEVERVDNGYGINWYVFSLTEGNPWFIKLWQNNSEHIVGEAVFDNLFERGVKNAVFKVINVSDSRVQIFAKIIKTDQDYWKLFSDQGFKNSQVAQVMSAPIYADGRRQLFTIHQISQSVLNVDETSSSSVKLEISFDGLNWQPVPAGEHIDFSAPTKRRFILKTSFQPYPSNKFYSPFLASVLFDYYCQK